MAIAAAACALLPNQLDPNAVLYVPETVGIVRHRDLVGRDRHYELIDGRVFRAPAQELHLLGGSEPQVDELLLAGSEPEQWAYHANLMPASPNDTPADCYQLGGRARANATHVFATVHDAARGDVIIVLPKASNWTDRGTIDRSDILLGDRTCINSGGEAFWHR